jgi:sulfofructose kinase
MTTILIAGLATIDFIFDVEEMPRQAEKYRARDARISGGGGAANAAVAIARLGGRARLAVRLGEDDLAALVLKELAAEGVDCGPTRRFTGRRTSFSSVFVDRKGERQIVNFRDETMPDKAEWLDPSVEGPFEAALADTRWPGGALRLMELARARGVPGVVDAEAPVAVALEALRTASHVAFSRQGLRDFSGSDDIAGGLAKAEQELGGWLCVTDGAAGVTFLNRGQYGHVPAFPIEAVDTLAAGDVWHGAFTLALGEGMEETAAIRFANAVAALKCGRRGGRAGYPRRTEVGALIEEQA